MAWDWSTIHLVRFNRLIDRQSLLEAMAHVGWCHDRECFARYPMVRDFLHYNEEYAFQILCALAQCRGQQNEERRKAKCRKDPPSNPNPRAG